MDFRISQKLSRITELFYAATGGGEQAPDRFQYGRVVVEQTDNVGNLINQSDLRIRATFVQRILDLGLI